MKKKLIILIAAVIVMAIFGPLTSGFLLKRDINKMKFSMNQMGAGLVKLENYQRNWFSSGFDLLLAGNNFDIAQMYLAPNFLELKREDTRLKCQFGHGPLSLSDGATTIVKQASGYCYHNKKPVARIIFGFSGHASVKYLPYSTTTSVSGSKLHFSQQQGAFNLHNGKMQGHYHYGFPKIEMSRGNKSISVENFYSKGKVVKYIHRLPIANGSAGIEKISLIDNNTPLLLIDNIKVTAGFKNMQNNNALDMIVTMAANSIKYRNQSYGPARCSIAINNMPAKPFNDYIVAITQLMEKRLPAKQQQQQTTLIMIKHIPAMAVGSPGIEIKSCQLTGKNGKLTLGFSAGLKDNKLIPNVFTAKKIFTEKSYLDINLTLDKAAADELLGTAYQALKKDSEAKSRPVPETLQDFLQQQIKRGVFTETDKQYHFSMHYKYPHLKLNNKTIQDVTKLPR